MTPTDREIQFDTDGTTTYGTLHVPAGEQRRAAVLLLAGSGPTDRDGNVPKLDVTPGTLKLIAETLGELGLMSLRFDKYFSGQTGGGAYADDPAALDLDAYLRQAAAAYRVLRDQPETSQGEMLIAGHSEGGMYALLLAPQVDPKPAGLALIEPQADRLLNLIKLQTQELIDAAEAQETARTPGAAETPGAIRTPGVVGTLGATRTPGAAAAQGAAAQGAAAPGSAAQAVAAVDRAIAQFRAGQPVEASELPPDVARVLEPELLSAANARYVRTDDAMDPVAEAARVAPGTRVLVTAGTRDTNVPMAAAQALAAALANAATTGPGLRVLAEADHFLHLPGTALNDQVLAPAATAALREWAQPYAR
jgi:pimeloyl-ACP methyl ester carboxylesterase